MIKRPTAEWRHLTQEQELAIANGSLNPDQAYAPTLWPLDFVDAVNAALDVFEADVHTLPQSASDEDVFAIVERVVLALNAVDEVHGRIETGEREELCEYIDDALGEGGVDVRALTGRRGIERHELTDSWRDW